MKAIHNIEDMIALRIMVVINEVKQKNESNSQQVKSLTKAEAGCD